MTISFHREGLEHKATKHLSDLIERIPQRIFEPRLVTQGFL